MAPYLILAMCFIGALFTKMRVENVALQRDIDVIRSDKNIDALLMKYKDVIGSDYDGYRNHIYRVLTYTMHYLDNDKTHIDIIGSALVYHDIALWTDSKLRYLEPGIERARSDLANKYSDSEIEFLSDLIYWHHKVTPFEGRYEKEVNAVRKADWIDATMGLVNHGMPRNLILAVQDKISESGFHQTLAEIGPRIYGWDVVMIVTELSSILKW